MFNWFANLFPKLTTNLYMVLVDNDCSNTIAGRVNDNFERAPESVKIRVLNGFVVGGFNEVEFSTLLSDYPAGFTQVNMHGEIITRYRENKWMPWNDFVEILSN